MRGCVLAAVALMLTAGPAAAEEIRLTCTSNTEGGHPGHDYYRSTVTLVIDTTAKSVALFSGDVFFTSTTLVGDLWRSRGGSYPINFTATRYAWGAVDRFEYSEYFTGGVSRESGEAEFQFKTQRNRLGGLLTFRGICRLATTKF